MKKVTLINLMAVILIAIAAKLNAQTQTNYFIGKWDVLVKARQMGMPAWVECDDFIIGDLSIHQNMPCILRFHNIKILTQHGRYTIKKIRRST